jgi:adenylate kinase
VRWTRRTRSQRSTRGVDDHTGSMRCSSFEYFVVVVVVVVVVSNR